MKCINNNEYMALKFIDDCEVGIRILGKKPDGIDPLYINSKTQYFGTFPFCLKDKYFTIFIGWDIEGVIEELDRIPLSNKLLVPSALIHAVIHPSAKRSLDDDYQSEYIGAGVEISTIEKEDKGLFAKDCFSKIGGKPVVFQSVSNKIMKILEDGYEQILQIDGDQLAEEVDDNELIDPCVLHVFVKPPYKDSDFLFFLQH